MPLPQKTKRIPRYGENCVTRNVGLEETEMDKQKFIETFADSMSRDKISLAHDVLMAGLSPYGGVAKMELSSTVPYKNDSTVMAESWSSLRTGPNETPGEYEAGGLITRSTASGHVVEFVFEKKEAPNRDAWLELEKVIIGADDSKSFYPRIIAACEKCGVPAEVSK